MPSRAKASMQSVCFFVESAPNTRIVFTPSLFINPASISHFFLSRRGSYKELLPTYWTPAGETQWECVRKRQERKNTPLTKNWVPFSSYNLDPLIDIGEMDVTSPRKRSAVQNTTARSVASRSIAKTTTNDSFWMFNQICLQRWIFRMNETLVAKK